MTLAERIRRREAAVAVVGLGRVGLPLAIALADAGLPVRGVEVDDQRRTSIELGKMPFHEPGADDLLRQVVAEGRLTVSASPAGAVDRADVVILCVGTPLGTDLRPDYGQLRRALDLVAPHLRPRQLVIQRSTVSPGTLQKVVRPFLARRRPDLAETLLLAACPERIAEGRALAEMRTLPEIVGAADEESGEAASAVFESLAPEKLIHRTDPTSAELAKLFTNVYRYVNFALANEFALLSEYYGSDAHEVIGMVNERYPRASVPMPGPTGGPCLSKDGYFLVEELNLPDFVLLAWKLNDSTPAHVVRKVEEGLAELGTALDGTPVAVLGRTFKRDSDDERESPSLRIVDILEREGARVRTHDPFVPGPTLEEALAGARAMVLATNHSFYDTVAPDQVADLMEEPRLVVDCWGTLDRRAYADAGIRVRTFGVGPNR
ncbi:MAG TPA: nucleotide sugar dehydrogenase [Actinomycetota bacterium]|nr:nucleotide sugar dehydrogenase [Actinomycetota bacterium]